MVSDNHIIDKYWQLKSADVGYYEYITYKMIYVKFSYNWLLFQNIKTNWSNIKGLTKCDEHYIE